MWVGHDAIAIHRLLLSRVTFGLPLQIMYVKRALCPKDQRINSFMTKVPIIANQWACPSMIVTSLMKGLNWIVLNSYPNNTCEFKELKTIYATKMALQNWQKDVNTFHIYLVRTLRWESTAFQLLMNSYVIANKSA